MATATRIPSNLRIADDVRLRFEIGDQIWACCECGEPRKWGEGVPYDKHGRYALNCAPCEAVTRHRFEGVA